MSTDSLFEALEPRELLATFTVSNLDNSGGGSLRSAIASANAAEGADVIAFQFGLSGTITLTSGDLNITDDLTINGPGTALTISGGNSSRILEVTSGTIASVSGLRFINGNAGASLGGAIANFGTLTLTNCRISDSQSGGSGGGIYSEGPLTLANTTVSNNSTGGSGNINGGGIFSSGPLTVTDSTISGNSAYNRGGGIYSDAVLALTNSRISDNITGATGGGIHANLPLTVTNSAISDNTSQDEGGGVYANSTLTLIDSTVTQNRSAFAAGGGVRCNGELTVTNSTFSGNTSGSNGGAIYAGGPVTIADSTFSGNGAGANGGALFGGDTLTLTGTTVSGNTATTGEGGGVYCESGLSVTDSVISGNVSGSHGGGVRSSSSVTSFTDSTIADNTAGGAGGGLWGDGTTLTVTNSTVSGCTALFGGGIYTSGTLTVLNSAVTGNTALDKGGGGGIRNTGGTVSVINSTISGNSAVDSGGGIRSTLTGTVVVSGSAISGNTSAGNGGGLQGTGTLTITNSTISGNAADGSGGGIRSFATLTLTHSTVSGNVALDAGGGIYASLDPVTVTNSTISGNSADVGGGVYMFSGALTITNSTIAANTALDGGGGVYNTGTATLRSSIVAGNAGGDIATTSSLGAGSTNNLIQNAASAGGLVNGVSGNLVGVNPLLGPLADNGGPTLTHALLVNSPAIGAGINPLGLTTDQRGSGFARARGAGVDIGALESNAPPTIASLTASASTVARGQSVTLTANSVADADGSIARVDFYRDANNNGVADSGEIVGADTNGADGYRLVFGSTLGLVAGSARFIAVAVDNEGAVGAPRSVLVTITNVAPTITSLAASASSVARGQSLTLTANSVADSDGTITRVDFYRDANNNGVADAGELIGSDSSASGGYRFVLSSTIGLPSGSTRFLAVAVDNNAAASTPRSVFVTITNLAPTLAGLAASVDTFEQGDPLTLTASGGADADGAVVSVSFFADANANGVADPDELLGTDGVAAGGFTYTLTRAQSNALRAGTVTFLAVATDNDGTASTTRSVDAAVLFSRRAGDGRLVAGSADNTDASRVVSVNPSGHVIVFEQGWVVADLHALSGGPVATGDAVVWVDPKDNLVYVAVPSAEGLLLFTRSAEGAWSLRNLSDETGATVSPARGLTAFTSIGGIVVLAGITDDGSLVGFKQTLAAAPGGGPAFEFIDISGDLESQGMATPEFDALISYVPTWDAWHLAGIDGSGRIQSVWINLTVEGFTRWRADDLTAMTGAPAIQGQLAVTLTSWGGINLTGLDTDGNLLTTWWVPEFGGAWQVNNLTSQFSGAPLAAGRVSGYTTPWGGLNYVGLDDDGRVMVYWWAPGVTDWSVSPLLPESVPPEQRPTGALSSSSSSQGTLNVYGTSESDDVLRMWWQPAGGGEWAVENLSEVAARV